LKETKLFSRKASKKWNSKNKNDQIKRGGKYTQQNRYVNNVKEMMFS
jgi:hypothetical protein